MPSDWCGYVLRHFCELPYRWSTSRGGCRLKPRHAGPCKPGRYR